MLSLSPQPEHPMKTMTLQLFNLIGKRPLWRGALALSVVVIFMLATTSSPYPIPSAPSDKVNHLLAFLELTLLARLGWPRARLAPVILALASYGLAIELVQTQLEHRTFSVADMLADAAGIGLGLLLWPILGRLQVHARHQRQKLRQRP